MTDFIFGTLSTDELRLSHVRALQAGVTHRSARSPRDPDPGHPIHLELTVGPAYLCDRAWVYWSTDGQDPHGAAGEARHGSVMPMELISIHWNSLLWGYVRRFRAALPGQPAGTLLRYRLSAARPDPEVFADQGAFYACYVDDDPLPGWAREAVIYQIFVDRFFPGTGRDWQQPDTPAGFYGGTLRGIIEKLDYVAGLGANTLWLTPIFPSPSHHGYDATELFDIEPRLGTKEDLRDLLTAAHGLGMRVLLDFVPNHWSSQHSSFQAAQADSRSPYRDWYDFHHWPDEYETFFGVKSLPRINLRHPAARKHVLDAARYWLEFGVDGFRLDYAIGPTPDFWADFRRTTRQARPDCWTFGEVVEPPDSQIAFDGLLDGCLDFMLLEALRETFAYGRWEAARFGDFLDRHEAFFPPDFSRPSFLDNHDMNRFLWAARDDRRRLKIAALCQFTLAGPPVIYYGTEAGLSQARDVRQNGRGLPEEARLPMVWGDHQDAELLDFYRDLAALRRQEDGLRHGSRRNLVTGDGCLAYVRDHARRGVLTAINLSTTQKKLLIEGNWTDMALATEAACSLHVLEGRSRVDLPPLSGVALTGGQGPATGVIVSML